MSKFLYIKTFGCQMNERDSEIIAQLLSQCGYTPTEAVEEADCIILNTCSIRAKAEQKVFSLLGQLRVTKKKKPGLLIGVAGCVAQQEGDAIFRRMDHVDLVVGTQQYYHLPEMIHRLETGQSHQELATTLDTKFSIPPFHKLLAQHGLPRLPSTGHEPIKQFVTIMQGCNNFCAYCIVPATRGREVSRPLIDILEEVQAYVRLGVREITLLGQNVNSYGMTNSVADTPVTFTDLLHRVSEVPGLQRLRFTTSNPKDLSDELIQCFGSIENLCP
jgi:tRNA-2-methylthio-N6-dimethylallyladenosine synthase